ncbi:hypothetical protein BH23ACT9_BH23ACT9_05010 [soil metagenome]
MAQPVDPVRSRRTRLLLAAVVLVVSLMLLRLPLQGYLLRPGPVFPLASQVTVEGASPLTGDFLFTTIQLDGATIWTALAASFDPDVRLVSRQAVLGTASEQDFLADQQALFDQTEELAISLALEITGSDLPPSAVTITGDGVGGPSAGLLITLAVADLASDDDIAGGRLIAGTGAVTETGAVRSVGGLSDKIAAAEGAGASVFLVPQGLLADARATGTSMTLIPVTTVGQAVQALTRR